MTSVLRPWRNGPPTRPALCPGGESGYQVLHRALDFVRELQRRGHASAVLIVHAGILRALLAYQQKLPGRRWLELRFDYEQVLSLHFSGPSCP